MRDLFRFTLDSKVPTKDLSIPPADTETSQLKGCLLAIFGGLSILRGKLRPTPVKKITSFSPTRSQALRELRKKCVNKDLGRKIIWKPKKNNSDVYGDLALDLKKIIELTNVIFTENTKVKIDPNHNIKSDEIINDPDREEFIISLTNKEYEKALEKLITKRPKLKKYQADAYQTLEAAIKNAKSVQSRDEEVTFIRDLGMRELITIKTDIVRYIRKEVAHIENVLAGEERTRTHSVVTLSERELTEKETSETIKETDTQKTELSSIEKEIARETEASASASASLSVTSDGPNYSAQADASGEINGRSAAKYDSANKQSSEVINRSVSRIRQQTETIRRTLERVETTETTEHKQKNNQQPQNSPTRF